MGSYEVSELALLVRVIEDEEVESEDAVGDNDGEEVGRELEEVVVNSVETEAVGIDETDEASTELVKVTELVGVTSEVDADEVVEADELAGVVEVVTVAVVGTGTSTVTAEVISMTEYCVSTTVTAAGVGVIVTRRVSVVSFPVIVCVEKL